MLRQSSSLSTSIRWKITWAWLGTHALTYIAALVGSFAIIQASSTPLDTYIELWNRWDSRWFESIAVEGYVGTYVSDFEDFRYNVAFFPGVPLLMRAGILVGLSTTATGMLLSLIAGLFAAFALARLTRMMGGSGVYGALAWIVAPTAVFLSAAYTEALFAAFAFWAWVWAREGRWLFAGLLSGAAAFVRPNGLLLLIGLFTMFVLSRPSSVRDWSKGLWLLLPILSTVSYFAYLRSITGSWTTWNDAQQDFWQRQFVDPWTSLTNTYELIFTFSPTGELSTRMMTEIFAMVVLIGVTVIVATRKWWPEAVYTGVTALSLGTSSMYHSVPRTLVVIFPLWILLGLWMTRSRLFRRMYMLTAIPTLALIAVLFTRNQWIS